MIAQFSAQHDVLREHHKLLDAAVEDLLEPARQDENVEVVELAWNLREHEWIEDEVMYLTVLEIARFVQPGIGA